LLLGGCQEFGRSKSAVEVIIEGGGEFPPSLVGKWKANCSYCYWQFVFEPDGIISSAVINMGAVEMTPGKVTEFPTVYDLYGGKGIFEPGQWSVQYSPDSRELSVEVVMHFYQDMGAAALEGSTTDILVGPVSENGQLWNADWFTFGRMVAYTPEPNEFLNDKEPQFRGVVTFEKVKQ
jgi:hypothetical protein